MKYFSKIFMVALSLSFTLLLLSCGDPQSTQDSQISTELTKEGQKEMKISEIKELNTELTMLKQGVDSLSLFMVSNKENYILTDKLSDVLVSLNEDIHSKEVTKNNLVRELTKYQIEDSLGTIGNIKQEELKK